jgi:hypothetical protein
MKTAWDRYLEQQLTDPVVRCAFETEIRALGFTNPRAGQSRDSRNRNQCRC